MATTTTMTTTHTEIAPTTNRNEGERDNIGGSGSSSNVNKTNNSTIGNIPFATSNWWKNGSSSAALSSKSESLSKVQGDDGTDVDDKDEFETAATATTTATATGRTVSSPSSQLLSSKTKLPLSPSKAKVP